MAVTILPPTLQSLPKWGEKETTREREREKEENNLEIYIYIYVCVWGIRALRSVAQPTPLLISMIPASEVEGVCLSVHAVRLCTRACVCERGCLCARTYARMHAVSVGLWRCACETKLLADVFTILLLLLSRSCCFPPPPTTT